MGAAKSLGYRPEPDPEARRRNMLAAAGVFGAIVILIVLRILLRAAATEPVIVVVTGFESFPLKAAITVLDGSKAEVARGASSDSTGRLELRLPPGAYLVTAVVAVRETDVGLANSYPASKDILVIEGAAEPLRVDLSMPGIQPHPYKPGQYSSRRPQ